MTTQPKYSKPGLRARLAATLLLAWVAAWLAAPAPAAAQEQFITQSGGRGLQNAKMNARMSKAENSIGSLEEEMAKVKPHAKQDIPGCTTDGDKLRWANGNWTCDQETDPTVQGWAKEALPSCGSTQILGVSGGRFSCMNPGYVSQELDPTVQNWAKQALPGCSTGEVLTVGAGGGLACATDERGLTRETDPNVHDFARNDVGPVPNCGGTEVLTMIGGRLQCRVDVIGITVEVDPNVQKFARTDLASAALTACAAGEVLRAETVGGDVVLKCTAAASQVAGNLSLDALSDVNVSGAVSGTALVFDGTEWKPVALDVPSNLSDLNDVDLTGLTSDDMLTYNGTKWVALNVPTCGTNELLTWTGSGFSCVTDVGSGGTLGLADLNDVTLTSSASGDVLSYNGTGWVNQALGTMASQDADSVAITGGAINGTPVGMTTPDRGAFTNLYAGGISVTTHVSVTGNLSAANVYGTFHGDGSGLTGVPATGMTASGVAGSIQFKGDSGEISGTDALVWDGANRNVAVAGSVQMATSAAACAVTGDVGKMRMADNGGGDMRLQLCVP